MIDFEDVAGAITTLLEQATDGVRESLKANLYQVLDAALEGVEDDESLADTAGYDGEGDADTDAEMTDADVSTATREAFIEGAAAAREAIIDAIERLKNI